MALRLLFLLCFVQLALTFLNPLQAQNIEPDTLWTKVLGGNANEPEGSIILNGTQDAHAFVEVGPDGSIYVATTTASTTGDVHGNRPFHQQDTTVVDSLRRDTLIKRDTLFQTFAGDTLPDSSLQSAVLRDSTLDSTEIRQEFDNDDRTVDTLRKVKTLVETFRLDSIATTDLGDSTRWATFRLDTQITTFTRQDSIITEDLIPSLDIWLIKLRPNGDTLWTRTYGGTNQDRLMDMAWRPEGGLVLVGHTASQDGLFNQDFKGFSAELGEGKNDGFLLELDTAGNLQGFKRMGGAGLDYLFNIHPEEDGGYVVLGETGSADDDLDGVNETGSDAAWIARLNGNLGYDWQDAEKGDDKTEFFLNAFTDLAETENLYHVIGFQGLFLPASTEDIMVTQYNKQGVRQFPTLNIGTSQTDFAIDIEALDNGNTLVLGALPLTDEDANAPFRGGLYDIWTGELVNFNVVEDHTYGRSDVDYPYGMTRTPEGNFLIYGYQRFDSAATDSTNLDFLLQEITQSGEVVYSKKFGGNGNDHLMDVAYGPDSSYFVAVGRSGSTNGAYAVEHNSQDLFIAKMEKMTVGLEDRLAQESALKVFPNPSADGRFLVKGRFQKASSYRVFSPAGRLIQQGQLEPGTARQQIDISTAPSGFYLLQVAGRKPRKLFKR